MRSPLALLTLALALLTAGFPCYRCTPAGGGTVGATVLVGSHAHDAPERECCGEQGCCGDDEPCDGAPRHGDDGHGPACCEHSSADPSAPSARVTLAPALAPSPLGADAEPAGEVLAADASWDAPVPRVPTETVVLLR